MSSFSGLPHNTVPDAELFASLLEISSEVTWVRNYRTGEAFWYASEQNRVKYAIPENAMLVNFWMEHLHPDDRYRVMGGYETAVEDVTCTVFVHEYRFRGRGQEYYTVRDTIKFLRTPGGEVDRSIGVWTDITEMRRREGRVEELLRTLEEERDRFKTISELSSAAMWEVDMQSGSVHWTAGNKTLDEFGFTKDSYSLLDWMQSIHPEDRDRVVDNFDRAMLYSERFFDSYRFIKTDGTIAHVIDQGKFVRDANGKALAALGSWIDVTRERGREEVLERALTQQRALNDELQVREEILTNTEEELRQINEQLAMNVRQLSEREFILNQAQRVGRLGSWEFDAEAMTAMWSSEMYNIFGVDHTFNISSLPEVYDLFEPSSGMLVQHTFERILFQDHQSFDITVRLHTPLGYKKWVRLTGFPVIAEGRLQRVVGITYDITFFKEAEERLKSSEEKFSKAFRNNPDLMTITRTDDLLITEANEKVLSVLGYERQEVINHYSTEFKFFVNAADRERYFAQFDTSDESAVEAPWYRKDGTIIQVMISSCRVEMNSVRYYISVIKDISDRKAAEEKFIKAFELSPDLMIILRERDLTLQEVNSKVEALSGYTREELLGRSSREFDLWVNEDERNQYFAEYYSKGSVTIETLCRRKDGGLFYATISSQRIQLWGEDHLLVVVRDVTGRKRSEERIRENEARLNAIINNTEMSIWSVDLQYRITAINRVFKEMILAFYNSDLSVGDNIIDSLTSPLGPDEILYWTTLYKRAFAGEIVIDEKKVGERHVLNSVHPIIENGRIIGASIYTHDITERVHREEEIQRNAEQLVQANKTIGELKLMALRAAMNPHFVFNALNSIQYFIAKNDRENAINYLSTFSKLIRGILTHSVNNKTNLANEIELLKHYVNLEMVRFENKFDLVLDISPELDLENTEIPSLLIQPFVENAILHGLYNKPEKGVLRIAAGYDDDDRLLFEVEDNGIGRAAAIQLRNQNFPKHRSMGTELTEERLALINERDNVSFQFVDLFDGGGNPAGTRVKVWVRLN